MWDPSYVETVKFTRIFGVFPCIRVSIAEEYILRPVLLHARGGLKRTWDTQLAQMERHGTRKALDWAMAGSTLATSDPSRTGVSRKLPPTLPT